MNEMFKNYPQPDDYIPNNRCKCHPCFKVDIMTGETASHSFEIPFDVVSSCSNYFVIYKLGIDVVIEKDKEELEAITTDCGSVINCKLSSEETSIFAYTCLSTKVQLKFIMNDDSIMFSDIYNVKVISSLDNSFNQQ